MKGCMRIVGDRKGRQEVLKETCMISHEPRSRSCLGGASKAAFYSWKTICVLIMMSLEVASMGVAA